jgi:uncharacterized membrane protein
MHAAQANATESETFDIVKMAYEIEARISRKRRLTLFAGAVLASAGIFKRNLVGAGLFLAGAHLLVKGATGRTPLEHAKTWLANDPLSLPSTKRAKRDTVDQAGVESFPASDSPSHSLERRS